MESALTTVDGVGIGFDKRSWVDGSISWGLLHSGVTCASATDWPGVLDTRNYHKGDENAVPSFFWHTFSTCDTSALLVPEIVPEYKRLITLTIC